MERSVMGGVPRQDSFEMEWEWAEIRLLVDDAVTLGHEGVGHGRIITDTCEMDLLVGWYRRCKNSHDDENCGRPRIISEAAFNTANGEEVSEPRLPPETRFIDVDEMRLVSISETHEFVALSYVWGVLIDENLQTKSSNVETRHEPDGLRGVRLPRTIADAISMTREMKVKYLWVDSLCIIQDNEDKPIQIQNMDRIYGLASLVLVAATGVDAAAGLKGFRDNPRTGLVQVIGTVQGLRLVVSLPPLRHILERSKWNTRGWTFQEWHLARRTLVFTDEQVYYVCSSSSFCEDIALEQTQPHSAMGLIMENCNASTMRHYLPGRYSRFSVNSGWIEYIETVESYSSREFTHDSDTLLAISGLLHNLHLASRNRFLCGLSVGLFHDALFWIPVNGTGFRTGVDEDPIVLFPSWSWAGWRGTVRYRVFPASERSLIEKWAVWTGSQIGTLGTPLSEPQNNWRVPGMTFFSDHPKAGDPEAEARRRGSGGVGVNHLDLCFLKFRAEIATLQLAAGVINDFACRADALLDQRGAYMGVAVINTQSSVIERATDGFQDVQCIAISVSKSKIAYMLEPAFTTLPDDEMWVNLIVVISLEDELYLRLGVGQVSRDAWNDWAMADIRDITLV